MTSLTAEQNTLLSVLLDEVTGTKEIVEMRKEHCRIHDRLMSSNEDNMKLHFTGSKAEGLDLAGSDRDIMYDIDTFYDIKVAELVRDLSQSPCANKFLLETENVAPGFTLLKSVSDTQRLFILESMCTTRNSSYLSSVRFVTLQALSLAFQSKNTRALKSIAVQGPSVEVRTEYMNACAPGDDQVSSLRCNFWPQSAKEWLDRPRPHRWPSPSNISSIRAFGCHLVPAGNPISPTKPLEWRLSFSIAERTLVWSFSYTQMHCYAVLKLLLKEFIKPRCSQASKDVLCSYFVKTFLFWQFESSDPSFWMKENMRECIMALLRGFYKCLQSGILRHYFIPSFNLLDIKLTHGVQIELLQLFDFILQRDIAILKECPSLKDVWSEFTSECEMHDIDPDALQNRRTITTETCIIRILNENSIVKNVALNPCVFLEESLVEMSDLIGTGCMSRPILHLVIKQLCFYISRKRLIKDLESGNKVLYNCQRDLKENRLGTDVASCSLWLATIFFFKMDYDTTLNVINRVLSSITPFALYQGKCLNFQKSTDTCMCRLRHQQENPIETWLTDVCI